MMPTFDWSNLVKGILRRGVFATFNPVVLFTALATGVATVAASAYTVINQLFASLPSIPQLDLGMIYSESDTTGLLPLFLYITNLKLWLILVNVIINAIDYILVFVPSFIISLLALVLVFRFSHAVRQTILDNFG